jgi:hypothetical protein
MRSAFVMLSFSPSFLISSFNWRKMYRLIISQRTRDTPFQVLVRGETGQILQRDGREGESRYYDLRPYP